MAMASTSFLMVGFSPIANIISELYDCSHVLVELQTIMYTIAFVPASFFGMYTMRTKGLAYTLRFAAGFVFASGWLRMLVQVTGHFAIASLGSAISSFGQTLLYCAASKMASSWFGDN